MEEEKELFFNALMLGNSKVGKTCFFLRYYGEEFHPHLSTVGIDSRIKNIEKNNKKIKLRTYDTAGQKRYRAIAKNYYKGADGIILMYSASDTESYNSITDWIKSIKDNTDFEKIEFIVVEDKCDLPDEEKKITDEMREKLEESLGFAIIEASAKDKTNVDESFDLLVDKMMKNREKKNEGLTNSLKIDKDDNDTKDINKKNNGNCCSGNKEEN